MQKRLRKSAATRIVIEKIGKRFLDQVGFGRSLGTVWHQIDLERELARGDKELPSALQQVGRRRRKGRAWPPTPSSAAALSSRSFTLLLQPGSCIFEIHRLKILKVLQEL